MILFVASNPSKLNADPEVAIVGAKCEKNFNSWVEYLSPERNFFVANVSDKVTEQNKPLKRSEYNLERLSEYVQTPNITKVVALGNTAADALQLLGVVYYKLPHPSPRNRFLNSPEQVEAVLEDCKQWLEAQC